MTNTETLIEEIDELIAQPPPVPNRHNGGPNIDAGAENIQAAGALSAKALRDAFEECAQRAVETAQANVERAREDQLIAEKFAEAVRRHGENMAQQIEAGFNRATKMASSMASLRAMISEATN